MIYAVDGSFVQNHEGKLKDWEKFTDCRVKIDREQVLFVLKSRKCLYIFLFVKQSRVLFARLTNVLTNTCRDELAVEIVCLSLFWADNN